MSNIINHEQWGKMNDYLNSIAVSLGSEVDTSTWAGVQKAVRMGFAPELFPVGTQFTVSHSEYGDKVYDVVAHDYLKSVHDKNAHTMTLLCHDVVTLLEFDMREAFYYAEEELPAGTYNFTIATAYSSWAAGTYCFELMNPLPKGGQLCINGDASAAMTTRKVDAYASPTATTVSESAAILNVSMGKNLGTFGVELNHAQRVSYGSNNYKESGIRQFLNSSAEAGSMWTPQTKFDRPTSRMTTTAGFMRGLESDFLDVVGEVIVPCAANNTYEAPDSTTVMGEKYTLRDKFYLASRKELIGSTDDVEDDSALFPYYEGATDTDRIKALDAIPRDWWSRSAYGLDALNVRRIRATGIITGGIPIYGYGCVPACTIV